MPRPAVLFVCVKNGGKSQMAAGLMRAAAGDDVAVHSAGTQGTRSTLCPRKCSPNWGIDISGERPKSIDPQLVRDVDMVVILGSEAHLDPVPGTRLERWDTVEPSQRGIDGIERMRLVRDDIAARVTALAARLASR